MEKLRARNGLVVLGLGNIVWKKIQCTAQSKDQHEREERRDEALELWSPCTGNLQQQALPELNDYPSAAAYKGY